MKTNFRFSRFLGHLLLAILAIGCAAPAQSGSRNIVQNQVESHATVGDTTFVILANRHTQPRLWPVLEADLRRDAAAIRPTAPVSAGVHIVLAGPGIPGPSFPSRLEVEFLGRCDTAWNAGRPVHSDALGWVLEDSNKIAPVIYVDCAQINDLLGLHARIIPENLRLRIASEAISHVILHEWIHIATQSDAHSSHGIMEPSLTAKQLTAPITDTASATAKSQKKSESGSEGGLPMTGFSLLIDGQR